MIAAASTRKLKVDPAIRTVDGCVSISGTRHSVPHTLAYSCKLVPPPLAYVSYFESLSPNTPDLQTIFGLVVYPSELLDCPSRALFRGYAKLSKGQPFRNWP